jgi:hypothetical protein
LLILLGFSGVLLAGAAYVAASEAGPYASIGGDLADRIEAIAADNPPVVSMGGRNLVLDNCAALATTTPGRLISTERRDVVARWCAGAAARFAAAAPSYGYAWYVAALMAADRGDADGFASSLARSYLTAPSEQWLAERRVALAEANPDEMTPDLLALHDRDLALLVRSKRGIATIVQRYVATPAFRDRISRVVGTLPNEEQSRFVAQLAREVKKVGSR